MHRLRCHIACLLRCYSVRCPSFLYILVVLNEPGRAVVTLMVMQVAVVLVSCVGMIAVARAPSAAD